jgi:alternate signal-mediated exported protein
MNKLVKGSIAGAAGIALLLGGAGTFALWNSTATLSAQTITAGTLSLAANNDGVWKKLDGTVINPATFRIIPGTTLEYTQTLTINAVGDGLKADLTHSGLTAAGALGTLTTETLSVTSSTATVVGNTLKFNAGTSTVNVKVTVDFPSTATTGQNENLDLSAVTFTLTQTV